jgi:flagellar export protein FliJ
MKREPFRLERVLCVKEQQKRLAELQELEAQMRLRTASARVEAFRRQLAENSAALGVHVGRVVSAAAWLAYYDLSRRLGEDLKHAEGQVHQSQQKVAEATRRRIQITREADALVLLRGQHEGAQRRAVMRRQQALLDELSVRRWHAARSRNEDEPS